MIGLVAAVGWTLLAGPPGGWPVTEALVEGDLATATALSEKALVAAPNDPGLLQLVAALYEANKDGRAAALRARAGQARSLPPPKPVAAKPGDKLNAVAPLLTIRRGASSTAPAAGWLGWGATISATGVEGEYVRFRRPKLARGPNVLVLDEIDGSRAEPPAAWEEVFVHGGFLSTKPRGPQKLLAEGNKLLSGNGEEALRIFDAVHGAFPDAPNRERLVRLAMQLGYPSMAVRASKGSPHGKAAWGSGISGEVAFVLGCRGGRRGDAIVRVTGLPAGAGGAHDPGKLPEGACLTGDELYPACPSPRNFLPEDATSGDSGAPLRRYEADVARHDARSREVRAELDRLAHALPGGAWAKVTLRNDTDGYAPPIWSLVLTNGERSAPNCEFPEETAASPPVEVARAEPLAVPPIPPRSTLELWIALPAYEEQALALSLSMSPEDVFVSGRSPAPERCEQRCF